jgi:hypothetical protein
LEHVLFWGVLSTSWCTYRFMGVDCIRLFWVIWVFIMYMSLDRERGRDHGIMQMVETRCDTMFAFWSNVLWCSVDRVSWQLGTWSAPRQKAWDYLKWSGGMPAMDYPDLAHYPSKISKGWMLMFVIDFAWFSLKMDGLGAFPSQFQAATLEGKLQSRVAIFGTQRHEQSEEHCREPSQGTYALWLIMFIQTCARIHCSLVILRVCT